MTMSSCARSGFRLPSASLRRCGHSGRAHKIIQMWAVGVRPGDLARAADSTADRPNLPPRAGTRPASPPNWDDPDGG